MSKYEAWFQEQAAYLHNSPQGLVWLEQLKARLCNRRVLEERLRHCHWEHFLPQTKAPLADPLTQLEKNSLAYDQAQYPTQKALLFTPRNHHFSDTRTVLFITENTSLRPDYAAFSGTAHIDIVIRKGVTCELHEDFALIQGQLSLSRNIIVEAGATLRHYVFGGSNAHAQLHYEAGYTLSDTAEVQLFYLPSGMQHSRAHFVAELQGEKAFFDARSAALSTDIFQNHCIIDALHYHATTTSNQDIRYAADKASTNSFFGNIFVAEHCPGSRGEMLAKQLVLSPTAQAYAYPFLEIFTDEVTCKHGATKGQIDQEALFYLRSRGHSYKAAMEILLLAFLYEPVIREPLCQARLFEHIHASLYQGMPHAACLSG